MPRRFWTMTVLVSIATAATAAPLGLDELRAQRHDLAFRQRRIMANNDGCDALYYPRDAELTPQAFLDQRTTALAGTQVDCISYCTISSGFSFFTHDTKVGTVLTRQGADYGIQPAKRNVTGELIAQGADCLKLVVDYAHQHGMEAFWAMRMNDTHDVAHRPDQPFLLFPPLKAEHPEWLVGEPTKRTPFGRWSSVNYAVPEIRDLAFRYIEEVCTNYDVDGIELDYFRHLCYFPETAQGGQASPEERAMLSEFMRRVRAMTEAVGCRRGRPILVAIRVPDSTEFSQGIGLDVEQWLKDGTVDLLITTGYFRFHDWDWTVALARQYGVAAYAGLSESRIRGETRFRRNSAPGYRARATNAWFAGVHGLYTFNQFSPRWPQWQEIGSLEALQGTEKLYFVSSRDGRPGSYLKDSDSLRAIPSLMPGHGLPLKTGEETTVTLLVGEDLAAPRQAGLVPTVTACVEVPGLGDPQRLSLRVNGQLAGLPVRTKNWLDFPVDPACLKQGTNQLAFTLAPAPADQAPDWPVDYVASALPQGPWTSERTSAQVVRELRDDGLLIADRGTAPGQYLYYHYPWGKEPGGKAVFEVEVKVISGVNAVIFGDGATGDRLRLYPDRVQLYHSGDQRVDLDTTDRFHTYRLEIDGQDLTLAIDGEPRLVAKGAYGKGGSAYRNEISFGAANSPEVGEAVWKAVRARGGDSASCNDFALHIQYAPANP